MGINGHTFTKDSPIGTMNVNTMQEWRFEKLSGHPLHLHVNPFQLTQFDDAIVTKTGIVCDMEYGYSCVGDWVDTLQLPTAAAGGKSDGSFRFMTDTFTGHEVM